jgi:hypothetical protein
MNQYKLAAEQWINQLSTKNAFAVTFTMKGTDRDDLATRLRCQRNMRHFLNLLNQRIFKNAYKRYGKRIEVVPVLELSNWHRLHYHLTIVKPDSLEDQAFQNLIHECWLDTDIANYENVIKPVRDTGWTSYLVKKLSTTSELDIENVHIAC